MDQLYDSAHMAEETVKVYIKMFVKDIISLYGKNPYNRRSNGAEMELIEGSYDERGF